MDHRCRRLWVVAALLALLAACGGDGGDTTAGSSGDVLEGRLMYSRFNESTHTFLSTHVSAPDGSGEIELALPGPEGGGRWSHSGSSIAVMTILDDERVGTAIIEPDGTVERVLAIPDETLNLVCTVWSPDDSQLACEGWDDTDPARGGIYVVDLPAGDQLRRATTTPDGMVDLPGDWTPDGSRILLKRSGDEEEGTLLLVAATGGDPVPLGDGRFEDPGRFSPDGSAVLTSSGGSLVLLDAEGAERSRIEDDGASLFGAVWSPDGSHIAFSRDPGDVKSDVYVSRPDGSARRQVTDTPASEIRVEWGAPPD